MKNLENCQNKLRQTGFKLTPQRVAVLEYLEGNTSHPSARKIFQSVRLKHPMISFATVYKTLKMLTEIDEIQSLSISENMINYDPDASAHGHFYCDRCGEIFDIFPDETLKTNDNNGHLIKSVKIYCYGLCTKCRKVV